MGQKLLLYYKYITEEAGLSARFELAKKTKIPSIKAAVAPDSPENIAKFRQAIEEITGKKAPYIV